MMMPDTLTVSAAPARCLSHPLITARHLALSVIIYIRQSSPGQVRNNWGSTNLQSDQGQLALDYGWRRDRVITIDEDLGKSASTTVGRTGWDEMLRLIATGTVGAVMAINVGRLARQLLNFEELRTLAKYHGVVLILDGRPVDPADASDTALTQVQAVFAQLDNQTRSKHLREARLAKAREGATVSQLPIGWERCDDGSFVFDPIVKAAIDEVYVVFRRVRTLRGTVAEFKRLGRRLPTRYRKQVDFKPPSIEIVRRFVINPAYAGVYLYGKSDTRPEYGLDARGKPCRRKLPEAQWIRSEGHHPAYITREEQQRFREQLDANAFRKRNRPNRGAGICQGLLRCARCGNALTVLYARRGSNRYDCGARAAQYAELHCFSIAGNEFDAAIEREFLRRLGNPLYEVCEAALSEARDAERTRAGRVQTEQQRLDYAERIARIRYEQVDPYNRLLAARLEREYNDAIAAHADFERQLAMEPSGHELVALEREFHELHKAIQDIPSLWRDPTVTHRERQEMLRCLIDHVVVDRTETAIEATIHWVDGTTSALKVWRRGKVRELVRQCHAEGMTARQIRDRLGVGDRETNQRWQYTVTHIYQILKRLGLAPNSRRTAMKKMSAEIDVLSVRGLTLAEIAAHLNGSGYRTSRGGNWTPNAVRYRMSARNRSREREQLHRRLLADAKARGLTNADTADEFNRLNVPRTGRQPWTADSVRQRRKHIVSRERRLSKSGNAV